MSSNDRVYLELAKVTLSAGSENNGSVAMGLSYRNTQACFSSPEAEQ